FRPRHRRGVDRGFVRPGQQQRTYVVDRTYTPADGQRHEHLLRGTTYGIVQGRTVLGRGGDVQESQLVRPGGIVHPRLLDRIAGIDQVGEVHALHHAAVLDVQAGDEADLQHDRSLPIHDGDGGGRIHAPVIKRPAAD